MPTMPTQRSPRINHFPSAYFKLKNFKYNRLKKRSCDLMHTSCFIISLLLLAPAVWTAAKQDKSDLELITEDFRILARITNAAFLQAALVRKDVKARDVIVEFLKVSPLDFDHITAIDAQSAIKSITKTYQNAQQLAKLDQSDKDRLRLASDFDFQLEERDNGQWNPVMKTSLEDLYTESDKIFQTFSRACSESGLELIGSLSSYINLDSNAKLNINVQILLTDKVKSFKDKFESIRSCFKGITDFSNVMATSSLNTDDNSPDNVLRKMQGHLLRLNDWKNLTSLIQEIWTKSGEIWGKESVSRSYTSIGQQLSDMIQFHKLHSDSLDSPPNSLTIGFLQPDDMQKVREDLKSTWFEKHFVRKASVEMLSKALKPFLEISKTIKALADKWFPIHRLDDETAENYQEVAEFLREVDDYVPNQKTYDYQIGLLVGTLSKCSKPPANEFNANLRLYENQTKSRMDALQELIKLDNTMVKFIKTNSINVTSPSESRTVKCFEILENLLPDDINETNSLPIIEKMRENYTNCVARDDYSMSDLVFGFNDISTTASKYRKLYQRVGDSDKNRPQATLVPLVDVVTQSNILPSLECLRNENFNATNLEKLKPIAKLLSTMSSPPNATFVKAFESYLGSIAQVKSALAKVEKTIRAVDNRPKRAVASDESNPVLALNISRLENENMGTCVKALSNLVEVRARKNQLLGVGRFDGDARDLMSKEGGLEDFMDSTDDLSRLLKQADDLNTKAKSLREKSLEEMSAVFQAMTHMRGILGDRDKLWKLSKSDSTDDPKFDGAKKKWEALTSINLNFQSYKAKVANGELVVSTLKNHFDHIFGHSKSGAQKTVIVEKHTNWIMMIGIFLGTLFLFVTVSLVLYGFTEKGKKHYKKIRFYYFAKPEEFEARWRFSLFMDMENGKHALLDAVRETNQTNMLNALKRGVYVNAYNKFGNTALHLTARGGHWKMVELLIKYGADRSLLNHKNLTAEQCIPNPKDRAAGGKDVDNTMSLEDKTEAYKKTLAVFKKYKKKKFRKAVPDVFPYTSFHIYFDGNTDEALTHSFSQRFESITSHDDIMIGITHYVVKTDENGIFEPTELKQFELIFNGIILVQDKWMSACLEDETQIQFDTKYLVQKFKYKGTIYDTVNQWSMAMAKSEMPFLCGARVAVVMREMDDLLTFSSLIDNNGGTMMNEFPLSTFYNEDSHPYLHSNLGPLFLIHDGTIDLAAYKADKMYTLFTKEEFYAFMLKREISRDTRINPVDVAKQT
ncbi:hypothetical protein B9Z55_007244 [Caenorhabditis nigoni]|uniref:Domain of unknown function WSN domain-containing protein n=1 Tax=Caenorhabditis nigoni TaxID=1611254 RepID=A0A2G5V9F3_9PELO|nr:hypothetical protein B9Z55_007244 [Caenorhabditis nigoni]